MTFDESITPKRSLGMLRKAAKTKDRSPDTTGTLKLQRHTFEAIAKQFQDTDALEIDCCLAGWRNNTKESHISRSNCRRNTYRVVGTQQILI